MIEVTLYEPTINTTFIIVRFIRAQTCCKAHTSISMYLHDKRPKSTRIRIGLAYVFLNTV